MEITTLFGILAGIILIAIGIVGGGGWSAGALLAFYDPMSIVIVVGGTIASIVTSYSLEDIKSITKIAGNAFQRDKVDYVSAIRQIIDLANVARKEGLLALEETVREIDDEFLKKGILLIVDGTDPELVRGIMEAEVTFVESRHQKGQKIFEDFAAFAPAFGMIGTLIGLIIMLQNLSDPDALGPGMAVALVTTFYGSLLANVVFTPLATKLKARTAKEIMLRDLLLEGMLSIQAGENPRIIEEKLYSFLPRGARYKGQPTKAGRLPQEQD